MKQKCYTPKNLTVFSILMKKESHIRELAKKTNLNPMTTSRVIKEMLEENIVDFRQEGKNKTFFLKDNFETKNIKIIYEYYKRLDFIKEHPMMRDIFKKINENPKIKLALMFGSYVKGLENKNSDIDIFIETEDTNIKKETELINSNISTKIGIFDKEQILIKEIIDNHIIIKGVEEYYERIS